MLQSVLLGFTLIKFAINQAVHPSPAMWFSCDNAYYTQQLASIPPTSHAAFPQQAHAFQILGTGEVRHSRKQSFLRTFDVLTNHYLTQNYLKF